jgi:2-C-methyl-D-erythritol 4-phosphate cytidylyltransferase / 2-C-methyl-D-erythritol 2,4-cyclodiphosphate synthase
MFVSAIVAAGGRGLRLGADRPKQFLDIGQGKTMIELCLEALTACAHVHELVVAVPPAWLEANGAGGFAQDLQRAGRVVPVAVVAGGDRRQDSVSRAFERISPSADIVLIHDAARPFVSVDLIDRTILAARDHGAAVAAVPAVDTVKQTALTPDSGKRVVRATLPRETIFMAQTPQAFQREILAQAIASSGEVTVTDEAMLVERAGFSVHLVDGDSANIKVTTAEDLAMARRRLGKKREITVDAFRIGTGYDLHRLVGGRPLILAGVRVPFERGLLGHSDADIICHAVTDAILGAAAAGDIGRLFPDTDPRWKDADSIQMLRAAVDVVRAEGFAVGNVDVTVVAERPKLVPYLDQMRANLARALGVDLTAVSIKGKTNEQLDATGRGDAMACHAVALLIPVAASL